MKCAWVENMMSIETDGWTRPCCLETSDLAKIISIDDGIKNAFNHHRLLDLRKNLIDGYSEKTRNLLEHATRTFESSTAADLANQIQSADKYQAHALQYSSIAKAMIKE
jgi:hypothetical protein